jgi:hypothetical protein
LRRIGLINHQINTPLLAAGMFIMLLTICIFFVGVLFAFVLPLEIVASDFKLFPMEIGVFRFSGVFIIILGIFSTLFGYRSFIFSKTGTPIILY